MSKNIEGCEKERLLFLIKRDGLQEAKQWALRTARLYRTAVLFKGDENRPPHYATYREYRRSFIESYLHFKRFALSELTIITHAKTI